MDAKPESVPANVPKQRNRSTVTKIKRGNVTVKIYSGVNRSGDKIYPFWTLAYYDGKKRVRKNFADFEIAKANAEDAATKLANGENTALQLTSLDRSIYVQAQEILKPFGLPINLAVSEYASAASRLPKGVALKEAVDFYLRRNPASLPTKTVRKVVDEMIAAKRTAKRSEVHVNDLESRLGAFARAMQMNIAEVTGTMIQAYLDSLGLSGRTQLNHLRHISSLFQFAVRRKYLTKDALDELEAVEDPEEEITEIEIFTPDELRLMFDAMRPEMTAWLAVAAFAGLRSAELQRLDWSEINLKTRYITVSAAKAKTKSRRLIPICDNLYAWLLDYQNSTGQFIPFENMPNQIGWLVEDVNTVLTERRKPANFKWKHNGLRHSFISYRLAIVKDVAEVSIEAGNSPNMIHQHYRELVTEEEAKSWFSVVPTKEEKILPMEAASVAA